MVINSTDAVLPAVGETADTAVNEILAKIYLFVQRVQALSDA